MARKYNVTVKPPSRKDLGGKVLDRCWQEVSALSPRWSRRLPGFADCIAPRRRQVYVKKGLVELLKVVKDHGVTLSSDGLTDRKGYHVINFCGAVGAVASLVGLETVKTSSIVKNRAFYERSLRYGLNLMVAGLLRANRIENFPGITESKLRRSCIQVSAHPLPRV